MASKKLKVAVDCTKKRAGRVDHESSRQQYLARSHTSGSKSFKYGKSKDGSWNEYKTGPAAMAAAKEWLASL